MGGGRRCAQQRLHRGDEPRDEQLTTAGTAAAAARRRPDDGAAVVDFVLVGALLTLVFVGVIQLGTVLHVRNTLVDCASEGARYGAFADRTPQDGAQRTRDLIVASLSARFAGDVQARHVQVDGLQTVEVTVTAPLPVIGLFGPTGALVVHGHGAEEPT